MLCLLAFALVLMVLARPLALLLGCVRPLSHLTPMIVSLDVDIVSLRESVKQGFQPG